MKKIIKIISCAIFLALIIISCKKEITNVTFDGGTNPTLSAVSSLTTPTVLVKTNALNVWNTLKWTNPNYTLSTGLSSQNVTYTVQVDTAGSNFTNPNMGEISFANDLSAGLLVGDLNKALNVTLKLKENVAYNVEMRVKSTLLNGSVPLYSNVIKTVITPYLDTKVVLPANLPSPNGNNGDLFLVGSATTGDATGWNNPVPTPSQKFTQTNAWTYEITYPLIGGKQYLFLPKNGDWGHKYAVTNNTVSDLWRGGDFDADKSDNFPGPPAIVPAPTTPALYKIVVDFKLGKFTVTKL
jgi:starch-binding outer membrane protein SusE/F